MSEDGSAARVLPKTPAKTQAETLFERIRGFDIFRRCPDDFIVTFAALAHARTLPQGMVILSEGQGNDRLLMLSSGKVEVSVDGETVVVLETPGDLMGEMSVLTNRTVTAKLTTLTEVEVLEITAGELEPRILDSKDSFGYYLYSALAFVLSDKIVKTNDKARRFEIANRALVAALNSLTEINRTLDEKVHERTKDLHQATEKLRESNVALETQNSELLASHRKLEELYSTKEVTFKRLSDLHASLHPLLDAMTEIKGSAPVTSQNRVERAEGMLESALNLLRPMSDLYSTEQAIRSRRVLLAEPDRKQQAVSKLALGGTGVRLDIAATVEETVALIEANGSYDLVFVSSELAPLIPDLKKRLATAKLVFMASNNVPSELPLLKMHAGLITNIVSRNPEDRTFTVKNIATTVSKLISMDIFGLEKYMIWGVEVQSRRVTSSAIRRSLIEDMESHLHGLGVRSTITDRAGLVAEEMLMNAIYDAPTGADGVSKYNSLPRTVEVKLLESEYADFRFACDGMLAAVSVIDPFGGFRMGTLLNYLERNYAPGGATDVQVEGKAGAGRGLHAIIENSDLVVFNVRKNLRTEVIALFNLDARARSENVNPSFHFFLE